MNQLLSMDARFHYGTEIALTVKRRTRSRVILTVALERRLSQSFCYFFFLLLYVLATMFRENKFKYANSDGYNKTNLHSV